MAKDQEVRQPRSAEIIETHVAEIKIEGDQLIPIFKIPLEEHEGPANQADPFAQRIALWGARDSNP